MGGWPALEAFNRQLADQLAEGDIYTDPADGSPPTNCPICFTRLQYRGDGTGNCPFGHYTWPSD
ncbi:MAG: hypothetical protein F4Y94_00635 [Chloroflexi bacterium]|nr:hypothetical protein [Chloroflexota bacterium]